jgi:hypothetical protein
MKWGPLAISLALNAVLPMTVSATDIMNGWSANSTVTRIYSTGSATLIKLSGTADGCGHSDYWSLPLTESVQSKAKLSILLTAYAAGKTLTLRCENSAVTDFTTLD